MKNVLFVAMSHVLTEEQKKAAGVELGVYKIVTLEEVNPQLQEQLKAVPASWDISQIKELSLSIVYAAHAEMATHFYMVGEPALTYWCNYYAQRQLTDVLTINGVFHEPFPLKVVQSTTERTSVEKINEDGSVSKLSVFKHVIWRKW
jgi:hypothetical protein